MWYRGELGRINVERHLSNQRNTLDIVQESTTNHWSFKHNRHRGSRFATNGAFNWITSRLWTMKVEELNWNVSGLSPTWNPIASGIFVCKSYWHNKTRLTLTIVYWHQSCSMMMAGYKRNNSGSQNFQV